MAGLDASLIGNLNALPEFKRSFGLDTSLDASRTTGVIFASMQVRITIVIHIAEAEAELGRLEE